MREAKPKVYEGPKGVCVCCDRPTPVAKGSTSSAPTKPWICDEPLMRSIYSSIHALIRSREDRLYVYDPQAFATGRLIVRSKLYFVDGGNGLLAGPFGPEGLKVFFGQAGRDDQLIYVVSTTHRSLSLIMASPLAASKPKVTPTPIDEGELF